MSDFSYDTVYAQLFYFQMLTWYICLNVQNHHANKSMVKTYTIIITIIMYMEWIKQSFTPFLHTIYTAVHPGVIHTSPKVISPHWQACKSPCHQQSASHLWSCQQSPSHLCMILSTVTSACSCHQSVTSDHVNSHATAMASGSHVKKLSTPSSRYKQVVH